MQRSRTLIVLLLALAPLFHLGCTSAPKDNPELAALYQADQADRMPETSSGDWEQISRNDEARQARARQMLDEGLVLTGADYFHAAMIYQHASTVEGIQLAHELAMISACLGHEPARWLAAASYDRMLMNLDRPQRFGTQYRSDDDGRMKLWKMSEGTTDSMRAALNVPSLEQAIAREAEMQKMIEELSNAGKRQESPPAADPK